MPASGYRNSNDGSLNNVGNNGNYWSASPNSNNAYNLNFNNNGNVNPSNNNNRANGNSVRCFQASVGGRILKLADGSFHCILLRSEK